MLKKIEYLKNKRIKNARCWKCGKFMSNTAYIFHFHKLELYNLPSFLKLYRWRWFIGDLKFYLVMKYLSKKSWFTEKELGSRLDILDKSLIDIWRMK